MRIELIGFTGDGRDEVSRRRPRGRRDYRWSTPSTRRRARWRPTAVNTAGFPVTLGLYPLSAVNETLDERLSGQLTDRGTHIVRIISRVAAAAALGCVALGLAGPAHADQVMEGVYNYVPQQGESGTWTIYPSCVPVVGDLRVNLDLPVACRLHVTGSDGITGGDARLTGGLWTLSTEKQRRHDVPDMHTTTPTTET